MDRQEETRLAWQRAQADLQSALAELERTVASKAGAELISKARSVVALRQATADEMLARHITQIAKS